MTTETKKVLSASEFEKKVEIEAAHLIYFDRLSKEEAFNKARQEIGSRFALEEKQK